MAYEKKIPQQFNCGLDLLGEVLYGKWKIRLLYFIHQGHLRPSQLQRKIPEASRRVLTIQLNELEKHELVKKKIYPELPPRVEYSLTDLAESLMPIIISLGDWGDQHQDRLRKAVTRIE